MDAVMSSGVTFGLDSACGGVMDAVMSSGVTFGLDSPCGGGINAGLTSDDTLGGDSLCDGDLMEDASCASEATVLFRGDRAGGAGDGTSGIFRRMGEGVCESGGTTDRVSGFAAAIGSITRLVTTGCGSGVDSRASQKTEAIKNKTAIDPKGIHRSHRRGLSTVLFTGSPGPGNGAF